MNCVSERTIDNEDDPKDMRVKVAGRVLRCLRPRVPHVGEPEGRDADQQARFLKVEVRPQAFEALFCAACEHRFQVSLDNLDGDPGDAHRFATDVRVLAHDLIDQGLPERPRQWIAALERHYHTAHRPLADRLSRLLEAPATPAPRGVEPTVPFPHGPPHRVTLRAGAARRR